LRTNNPLDRIMREIRRRDCAPAAEPIYRLLGGAGRLQFRTPDAPHSFRPAIREAADQFLVRHLGRPPAGLETH
jgi:hypothetical protein